MLRLLVQVLYVQYIYWIHVHVYQQIITLCNRVKRLVVSVCIIYNYVIKRNDCFAPQCSKNSGLLVCLCIYMPPNLSATPGESQIKRYSSVFYLHVYAPIILWPVPHGFMGSIYVHSYGRPILVCLSAQCIQ